MILTAKLQQLKRRREAKKYAGTRKDQIAPATALKNPHLQFFTGPRDRPSH